MFFWRTIFTEEGILRLEICCFLPNQYFKVLLPLTTNVPHHINTSQSICFANQLTDFYMMRNIGC